MPPARNSPYFNEHPESFIGGTSLISEHIHKTTYYKTQKTGIFNTQVILIKDHIWESPRISLNFQS